jgi:hypothetical protein
MAGSERGKGRESGLVGVRLEPERKAEWNERRRGKVVLYIRNRYWIKWVRVKKSMTIP